MVARLLGIYAVVFAAELPDKTALASLVLASRLPPRPVLLGACAAFTVHCALAVGLGTLLSMLPTRPIHIGSGIVFLILAVLMWLRKVHLEDHLKADGQRFWHTAWISCTVIFVAEFGDLTQFAIASLAARDHAPAEVFAAGCLALWSVTLLGVVMGNRLRSRIPPRLLERIAAVAFAVVGVVMLAQSL